MEMSWRCEGASLVAFSGELWSSAARRWPTEVMGVRGSADAEALLEPEEDRAWTAVLESERQSRFAGGRSSG